jgi:hypothetical protein
MRKRERTARCKNKNKKKHKQKHGERIQKFRLSFDDDEKSIL